MKHGPTYVLTLLVCSLLPAAGQQASVFPGKDWAQTSPASAGWDIKRTDEATAYAKQIGATSFMLIQHGVVVMQFGDVAARTELHSCRKSFLSALIGNAVDRGQIHLDDTLETLGIDDNPPSLTPQEKQATVRMLLQARSGVYHVAAYETAGMEEKRPERGSHPPGTFWYYNNWDFNTLGAIYAQAVGHSVYQGVADELGAPIGMQDFRAKDGHDVRIPESRYLAYTMRMSARDFARFALLYLHGGNWDGKRIVPSQWVADSTHPWSNTSSGGYGYLWWTGDSATPNHRPHDVFPPGSFWLEGHLGEYAVVVPSNDLIVVVRVAGDHPSKTVDKAEMSTLVKMIVDAAKQ